METVDELAVKPFRDVVEKGKLAVDNAGDSQDMLKEAQRLVKVGERGLTRIEASCRKLYNEYGNNFILALKENVEITEYRKQLTDLLWDFEDFIEADTFKAEKFHELQALNREAGPKVYNILITMKLEVPNHYLSQLSPPSSPRPQSLFPLQQPASQNPFGLVPSTRGSMSGSQGDARSVADYPHVDDVTTQLQNLMFDQRLSSVQGQDMVAAIAVQRGEDTDIPLPPEQPLQTFPRPPSQTHPRPPSLDPWYPQSAPGGEDVETTTHCSVHRRPTVYRPESPVDPAICPICPDNSQRSPLNVQQPHGSVAGVYDQDTDEYSDYRHSGSSTQSNSTNATSHGTRSRPPTLSPTIPEEDAPRGTSKPTCSIQTLQVRSPLLPPPRRTSRPPVTSRVEDMDRQYKTIRQLQGHPPTISLPPPPLVNHHGRGSGNNHQSLYPQSGTPTPRCQTGLEMAMTVPSENSDHGLIPVATEDSIQARLSPKDCTIGSTSTFYQYKGFCEGAKEVIRGEIGIKKTKKPGFSATATVARCTGCFFELDFSQIEYDLNKEDKGNFYKSGISYRLRFLQKSHLPAKRVDDVLYACVFCVQAGRTIHECDATVFTTSKALFNHLIHHPRPLPKVPGIAVVEGASMPAHLRNDYDVHFRNPPEAHPAQLNLSQISGKPTGVTRDHSRRLYGQRLLFDRSPALELCHGARVVGINWPEKYNGEWIFAWHDGICASVPADIIKLDAPPFEDIRMMGSSLIRAKSRWKFHQKDKDKDKSLWLRFDKNESIINIGYPTPDFWCWSGTNSKGKWGIFPKTFLEPSTIQELTAEGADRAMTLANEKNKSSSMLAKFASKRRPSSGRPQSAVEPTSSHETLGNYYASISSHGST
ncbi:hypothetical protein EsDP_00007358 [Epichloe bromicola]|uniref:SH3 domain-containing protein n=1 Tax=Epichloe bromicola TaxID=79588 RepID=A0ABQ0D0B7_9HYPO